MGVTGTHHFLAENIDLCDIERLQISPRHARTHSKKQVRELAGSIAAYGFINPLVIDADGVIIAGYGRLLAAKQLGLSRVPVIIATHLSDRDKRAYALADNRIALNAEWDEELLEAELAALALEGVDLATLGFDEREFDSILAKLSGTDHVADEDAVPEPPAQAVTEPGDVWVMADHRLLCGDATKQDAYRELLKDGIAHVAFCDPPYNVAYQGRGTATAHRPIANDDLGAGFAAFLSKVCTHILNSTKGGVYICMSSSELHTLYRSFVDAGGHWSTFIIWGKNMFTLGRSDYQRQYEPILYGWNKKVPHYWCGARDQGDLWLIDKPSVNDLHPTMKPVALVERAIMNSSRRGDTVLDPFGGSGTTLIAAEKTGRKARLMEIDPLYCDVMIDRWQQQSGKQAVHTATGLTFNDLRAERTGPASDDRALPDHTLTAIERDQ